MGEWQARKELGGFAIYFRDSRVGPGFIDETTAGEVVDWLNDAWPELQDILDTDPELKCDLGDRDLYRLFSGSRK